MRLKLNNNKEIDTEEWHKLLKLHVKRIPNCATFEQFKEWRMTTMSSMPPYKSWFCTDCTPQYQNEMKNQGRCDHLYIRFENFQDGVEGYIDSYDQDLHRRTIYKLHEKV